MSEGEKYSAYSLLLDRTARRVKQYAQKRFRALSFEITVDQWAVLKQLFQKGDLNQKELAELCFKDHPTLTRIIDLLVQKRLIERNVHPTDRRSFMVCLTPDGKQKVERLLPEVQQIRTKAWENLDEADFREFKRILDTIYENLEI